MKITVTEGCSYSMEIDGREFVDLSAEEQKEVLLKLVEIADTACLQKAVEDIVTSNGEYEDLGYCEQCGEYNSSYTLDINTKPKTE